MVWKLILKFLIISAVIGFILSAIFGWISDIFDNLRFWN